jgi:pimeloyl-ACP methyl ester carboxylesterase
MAAVKKLIIINGLSADISQFKKIFAPFYKHYNVLLQDNCGASRSGKPNEPYSIEQMTRDTMHVMQAANFEQASILGVSMGGRIAIELAIKNPQSVNKLILVSTAPKRVSKRGLIHKLAFDIAPRMPFLKGSYPQPYYAYKRQHTASMTYDASKHITDIQMSTLIMHGQYDKIVPMRDAESMHQTIQKSQFNTLAGGHLFFMMREHQNFIKTVNKFMAIQ